MDKKRYFEISQTRKVEMRCPIYRICQRRVETIANLSFHHRNDVPDIEIIKELGEDVESYIKNRIQLIGEAPEVTRGDDFFFIGNCCP